MEILPSVRKWLSSASSQSYDTAQQTPDSLLEKARKGSFPSDSPEEKSVMAPIPSKEYIPPTPVRPFSEEISAAVREQYQKFQQPKEVVRFLSELAIDPTTYIPASKGIGITAAGLGILTGLLKAGTIVRSPSRLMPNLKSQVGAFRPSDSVISPLALTDVKALKAVAKELESSGSLTGLLWNKISNKELQKYGTPEFLMDAKLRHTTDQAFKNIDLDVRRFGRFTPRSDNALELAQERMTGIRDNLAYRRGQIHSIRDERARSQAVGYGNSDARNIEDLDNLSFHTDALVQHTEDLANVRRLAVQHVRGKADAARDGKDFYTVDPYAAGNDIDKAVFHYAQDLEFSPLSPDQLSKKSLQQLLIHADDVAKNKAELLRKEEESLQKLPEFTKARTATLQAEQGLPGGFVELKQPADFGAETEFLNHCVGAGGYDSATSKYKFQHHPISGREVIKNEDSSFSQYKARRDRGDSRFFSYRPEGQPVLTFEVGTKYNEVSQIFGRNNRPPTNAEEEMIINFVIDHLKPRDPPNKIPYEDQI